MGNVEYSVIVPVYNVEKVLSRCIESILSQTFSNFELILIDDGSTDKSGEICDEYKKKDERIKVVHQKNQGVSKARNVGLDISKGKYIVFVDSDDYVDNIYLESFNGSKADLVISGIRIYNICGIVKTELTGPKEDFEINSEKQIINFLKSWYAIQVYAKRYKREKIKRLNLKFDQNFQYGEDSIFVVNYVKDIENVKIENKVTYNFCQYSTPSLSKLKDDEWIVKYTLLQAELCKVLRDYKFVIEFLMNKYWWVWEKEINRICEQKSSFLEKRRKIRKLLELEFFQSCLQECNNIQIDSIHRYCLKRKKAFLVLIRYGKMQLIKNRVQKKN